MVCNINGEFVSLKQHDTSLAYKIVYDSLGLFE